MKHIFKCSSNGEYTNRNGDKYDCKCIAMNEKPPKGWHLKLDDALKKKKSEEKKIEKPLDEVIDNG